MKAGRCFLQTVGVLVLFSVARTFHLLGPEGLGVGLLIAALLLIAWGNGATPADLGLEIGRAHV